MSSTKIKIRFYTIADFKEEENWLREQHKEGWKLTKLVPPCFYHFEKCAPEDVIYRVDYKNSAENKEYMQLLKDYGWECCGEFMGCIYARKSAAAALNENDCELFSDKASRKEAVQHIMKTRLVSITLIFLFCVVPNAVRSAGNGASTAMTIFWVIILAVYVYLLIYCKSKLTKLRDEAEE